MGQGKFVKMAGICKADGNNLVEREKWMPKREKYGSKEFGKIGRMRPRGQEEQLTFDRMDRESIRRVTLGLTLLGFLVIKMVWSHEGSRQAGRDLG